MFELEGENSPSRDDWGCFFCVKICKQNRDLDAQMLKVR